MPDRESRHLDAEILRFIKKYSKIKAPDATFQTLAFKLFEYQYRRNRYYRNYCSLEKRSPRNVKSWKDIPAIPALAFKELTLTCFPAKKRVKVFKTSGTSSRRERGAHFFDTLNLYEHSLLPPFGRFMRADGAFSFYFLMPSAANAPHSSLSYMMQTVSRQFSSGPGKFYVKNDRPRFNELASDLKNENGKVVLAATAFALKGFLDFLAERKVRLRLRRGSRIMETGGFKGRTKEISKKSLYAQCAGLLGVPKTHCVSEYGMTELSSQMYAIALRDFTGPAWLRTRVIDPRTGKEAKKGAPGLLRHVDLANRGSVMAVQTEDLGRATGGGFQLLGRARGSELRGCSLSYEEFIKEET